MRALGAPLFAGAILMCASCSSDEGVFTDGRLEDPCNASIPVCSTQAACVLDSDEYYRSEFPGGARLLVRTETENAKMIVRVLLDEPLFPGTEFRIQAFEPGCGNFDEQHIKDVDLFQVAGDDRLIELELELVGRGDHLLEVFSDMSSTYLLAYVIDEEL